MKMSSSSSTSFTTELSFWVLPCSKKNKPSISALLRSYGLRISRSLSKTRTFVAQTVKTKLHQVHIQTVFPLSRDQKCKKKITPFGTSFRFHYNWSSSRISYYDATIPTEGKQEIPSLSGYLEWLEEKDYGHYNGEDEENCLNEIDELADKFIAKSHEKFILEKQESYRRSIHGDPYI